jgi:hypothetical protein
MMKKTEPAKNRGEESVTFGVVVHLQVQGVRNERFDGHTVDGVREWNARCCDRGGVGVTEGTECC